MVVCGVDIGLLQIAYAILSNGTYIASETMDLSHIGKDDIGRYLAIYRFLSETLASASHVGIESVWVGPNRQISIRLAKAWGVACGAALDNMCVVYDIAPTSAKKAICGKGNSSKEQVLANALSIGPVKNQHEADALAVAYCVWKSQMSS